MFMMGTAQSLKHAHALGLVGGGAGPPMNTHTSMHTCALVGTGPIRHRAHTHQWKRTLTHVNKHQHINNQMHSLT